MVMSSVAFLLIVLLLLCCVIINAQPDVQCSLRIYPNLSIQTTRHTVVSEKLPIL